MKTTIDIPDAELEEVIRLTGARTKREAVVTAITEFNRRKRRETLAEQLGTFDDVITAEQLARLREAL
jgi:Arc/MetJ family transcription regulator